MGNGIFTRNYDNICSLLKILRNSTEITSGTINFDNGTEYGDGSLRLKSTSLLEILPIVTGALYDSYYNRWHYGTEPLSCVSPTPSCAPGCVDGYSGRTVSTTTMWLGSGNTEETYDDYDLQTPLTMSNTFNADNNLQYTTCTQDPLVYNSQANTWERTIHWRFIACKTTTIGELGLFYNVRWANNNSDAKCLVYRKVFTTPYNLTESQTVKISLTIGVPANSNKPVTVSTDIE